jgi:UDP-N-acetylglucosamine 4,6-dehydratase
VAHWLSTTDHRLIVFSRDELKQAQLKEKFPDPRLDCFLGDVRDLPRVELAMGAHPDAVIHAAALKRVDAVCHDPDEILKTNILGTRNVLHAVREQGVAKCLLISTDKACYPTTVYGASKLTAEILSTAFNAYSYPHGTCSASVRYGNVLNSRGSVVPIWRQQRDQGLPLSITDPRMTRFLITFPQAIALIEYALETMEGGEVFVPRLKAASMIDMAHALAGEHYPLHEIGLRPGGEKLHETLLTEEEYPHTVFGPDYATVIPDRHRWRETWAKPPVRRLPLLKPWCSGTAPRLDPVALTALLA